SGGRPLAPGGCSRRRGVGLRRTSGVRLGICVALTHVRSLAFSGGRGRSWGKIGLFGRRLHLVEWRGVGNGAALCWSWMLGRTSGSVLGGHDVVVGPAVDLANSGCIVGMVALGTTRP